MLTITGTVRNPSSGVKVEGLTAVVSLLDRNGALVSTKDVPLDYRALGPGEEAPFKVSIPDPGSIARYRVSFRAGTDVVPHVDRRSRYKTGKCAAMSAVLDRGSTMKHMLRPWIGLTAAAAVVVVAGGAERRGTEAGRVPVPQRRRPRQRDGDRHRQERPVRARAAAGATSSSTKRTSCRR